jgi:hypothetical protein
MIFSKFSADYFLPHLSIAFSLPANISGLLMTNNFPKSGPMNISIGTCHYQKFIISSQTTPRWCEYCRGEILCKHGKDGKDGWL